MDPKKNIQELLQQIIGAKITLEEHTIDSDKEIFCNILESWVASWEKQQYIYELYQIDLQGYDESLYEIIDAFVMLYFKNSRLSDLILWYVYERKNIFGEEEEYAKLYNSKNGNEIDISTTEKFWGLIQEIINNTIKVDDLEVIGLEEVDEDEEDEEEE
ncbi:MAG: hypothetical protein WCK82_03995 [Bacteroidota bacterium]|jgi:hypothetical protein